MQNYFVNNQKSNQFLKVFIIGITTIILFFLLLFFNSAYGNFSLPASTYIWRLRIVEIIKVIVSGWSIGISNYCLQYVTKNKFADVGIFGTYSFLQLTTMIAIMITTSNFVLIDQNYQMTLIYSAIGLISGVIFYFVSYHVKLSSKRILIYGIFLNTLVFSMISLILNLVNLNPDEVNRNYNIYLTKMLGSISGDGSTNALIIQTVIVGLSTIYLYLNKHKLLALSININKINTLNINFKKFKFIILILIGLLSASTFALVGYIAFLGVAINFVISKLFKGIKLQFLMCIIIAVMIMIFCQLLTKIASYYFVINNKTLPLSAFYGFVSFPLFISALFSK